MKKTRCPACKKTIELEEDIDLFDLIKCSACKTLLEVVRKDPPELDWADDHISSSSARKIRTYKEY
jgi:lysine biosynthesis protein LysW